MIKNMAKFIGALALLLAAVSANAQSATQVTVPFEFTVAGQILPPGDYRVSLNEGGNLVKLSGQGIRPVVFLTSQGDRFQDERNVLRFQRHGDGEWALRQVVVAGLARVLPAPKSRAHEMASDASPNPAIIELPVVASGRPSSSNEGVN